jgi:hypothetical protein
MRFPFLVITLLLIFNSLSGQSLTVKCVEKESKNPDEEYPTIVRTCFIKNFKFKETAYPDYVGRYFDSDYEVYVLVNKKYIKTLNSKIFNKNQNELVSIINKRIKEDFKKDLSDSTVKECFIDLAVIPTYKIDDLKISFQNNEIWFEVNWGLTGGCRAVDGTIISFKLSEIQKYLN